LLFASTVRALHRPLPEQYWIERSPSQPQRGISSTHDGSTTAQKAKPRAECTVVGDAITRLFRFANPLLQREVHGKFRMRRVPLAVIVIEVLLVSECCIFSVWPCGGPSRIRHRTRYLVSHLPDELTVVMIASP
jgi:hypothetical protein